MQSVLDSITLTVLYLENSLLKLTFQSTLNNEIVSLPIKEKASNADQMAIQRYQMFVSSMNNQTLALTFGICIKYLSFF